MGSCWAKFDADAAFAFTTPRVVRIQDRWLGIPYYSRISFAAFLAAIMAYIVGVVIVQNQGYLAHSNADGITRLQLKEPNFAQTTALDNLPYCTTKNAGGITKYQVNSTNPPQMQRPFYQYPCVAENEIQVVYPPEEVNAMFITTRLSITDYNIPDSCDPELNAFCDYNTTDLGTVYQANLDYFTLKLDHALDIPSFNIFQTAATLNGRGLRDANDNPVDLCDFYDLTKRPCPTGLPNNTDIWPIGGFLLAAGVPGGTLDSTLMLDTVDPDNTSETRRYGGMVLLVDIEYSGVVSMSGSTKDITYSIRPRFAVSQEYKIQQMVTPNNASSDLAFQLWDRHGIRIIVRQTGTIGQFNFQAMLVSLTSSLALLAVARTVVEVLAFYLFPLNFIYKQYRQIDTIDFSVLTDGDKAEFKKHDKINPPLRLSHVALGKETSSTPLLPVGNPSIADAIDAPQAGKVGTVQERVHRSQDGFWGDLNRTYQRAWDGEGDESAEWQGK